MAAKIFRINYKSDFILTLNSDAGWMTPFCIKFWTGAPSQAYFVGWDGTTYTHCSYNPEQPTKLVVQFDDHHLPIGDLKFQIAYHFTVADFPNDTEDEVINPANITTEIDGQTYQVMLDFTGETAPEIEFSLPAYANEAQRIANEQQRISNEETRIENEQARIQHEETRISQEQTRQNNEDQRIRNEQTRISQEEARVREFATLKQESEAATTAANNAAALANQKAQLAADKAQLAADKAALAQDAANLANQKAQLAADKAALAQDAADLANQKAQLAQQKAEYAKMQGDYAKQQGDYAKEQGDYAKRKGDDAATQMQQQAQAFSEAQAARQTAYQQAEGTESGSVAGDGSRWGAFKTNEAARDAKVDAKVADITNLQEAVAEGAVYDVSAQNPTAGPNNDGKWGSLSALLSDANFNTLIPTSVRRGGMSIKFVCSSDNKYVQFRLMSQSFSTTESDWQGVIDELKVGSKDVITSGAVEAALNPIIGSPKVDYEWESNGYYAVNLSSTIGSSLPSLTSNIAYRATAKIPCNKGDKFVIHSRIGVACAYFFLDSSNKISYIPQDSLGTKYKDANNNTEITAPEGSSYLIVQTTFSEWKSSEFGGDGTTGIYPYREATSGVVGQVEQNTSDIESINTQLGDHSGGMIKDIDDLQTSDELQNTKIDDLEGSLEDVNERIDGVAPKNYDKSKSYFTMELSAGSNDIRTFWNATNIKNEAPGTCFVDWGDGTPVVAIVNDDSLNHNYAEAGTYEICISGLTGLTNNMLLRGYSVLRDAKFGNTFTNTGTYYMLSDTSGLDSVEFFATTPLSWGTTSLENMKNVNKIIVPNESLMKYLSSWYFSSITQNKDALTKKIVPKEPVGYIYNDKVVTVGTGGDFTSINDAIQNLSQSYPLYKKGGIKAVVKILSGTIINEQVYVDGLDLSWITIEYEDYNPESLNYDTVAESIANSTIVFDTTTGYNSVAVDASSWDGVTHDTRGDVCLLRAENGGRLPIINCVFKLTTPNSSYPACGCLCNRGSEAVIKTLCGFIGFQDGVISNNESSITIREGITLNCSRWGCHARHNGEVSARSVIATGCATDTNVSREYGAAVADRVADIDVREAYLGGNVAIRCNNVSRVCARAAHVLSGGVANGYLVEATYSGKINASDMTFSDIIGSMFKVQNAGLIDAFAVTNKTYSVSALNAIDGSNGIIWG